MPLPVLLARVRAVASERRLQAERLQAELESARTVAADAKRLQEDNSRVVERFRAAAETQEKR